jgi:hypothetical protein
MDRRLVASRNQMKPGRPFERRRDAVGVMLAVGDGVRRLRGGERVACSRWPDAQ